MTACDFFTQRMPYAQWTALYRVSLERMWSRFLYVLRNHPMWSLSASLDDTYLRMDERGCKLALMRTLYEWSATARKRALAPPSLPMGQDEEHERHSRG